MNSIQNGFGSSSIFFHLYASYYNMRNVFEAVLLAAAHIRDLHFKMLFSKCHFRLDLGRYHFLPGRGSSVLMGTRIFLSSLKGDHFFPWGRRGRPKFFLHLWPIFPLLLVKNFPRLRSTFFLTLISVKPFNFIFYFM